ncbi:MAG: hypothetical protein JO029_09195 [Candidatus Eremiobacteraeota bacterium]|nr:hypothetical protein [Candidatus Eremiobacteraeota bacterium]
MLGAFIVAIAATTAAQIAHSLPTAPPLRTPPRGALARPRLNPQAAYVYYNSAVPDGGFDAMRITMSPRWYREPHAYYYWAYDSNFVSGPRNQWYTGLQPGSMALFSVFGDGAVPAAKSCFASADSGPGTSCHISYPWTSGHFYDLTVTLARADAGTETWQGTVTDDNTGETTLIGRITVPRSWGNIGGSAGINFDEYYQWQTYGCAVQPQSQILFLAPVGYANGREYRESLQAGGLAPNDSCKPVFYSDGSSYAYVVTGTP